MYTLRTMIIVVPPLTFRTYQILPHTNRYFHCLYSSPPPPDGVPLARSAGAIRDLPCRKRSAAEIRERLHPATASSSRPYELY